MWDKAGQVFQSALKRNNEDFKWIVTVYISVFSLLCDHIKEEYDDVFVECLGGIVH